MSADIKSNNSKLLAENVLKRIQEYSDLKLNVRPYLMIYNDGDGNDYYCIAMGSYYSDNTVGKKFKIDLDNGKSIYAITGDVKSDKETDINHQYSGTNGKETMLSFIVGDDFAYKYPGIGNCSKTIPELSGDIAKVHYLGDINTEINTSNVTIEDCAWNLE